MSYTIYESVNNGSTHYDGKIFDAVATGEIENGTFGYIDGLQTGSDTIYVFKKGTKAGEPVYVVDQPAWDEDNHHRVNQRRDNFTIPAGTPFRVRELKKNDKFGITIDGVTAATQATMDVGKYVTIDASTGKLVASGSASGATFEGVVEGKRVLGGTLVTTAHTYGHSAVMYKVRVIACGDSAAVTQNVTNQYTVTSYVYTEVAAPTGNPHTSGYYEKGAGNVFTLSADETVDAEKTYYTRETASEG